MVLWKKIVILFCASFITCELLVWIIEVIYIKSNNKKKKKKSSKSNITSTAELLLKKYKIDLNVIGINRYIATINLLNSFIISTAFTVTANIENLYLSMLVGCVIFIIMILCCYEIVGRYFERMCMNYEDERNRE